LAALVQAVAVAAGASEGVTAAHAFPQPIEGGALSVGQERFSLGDRHDPGYRLAAAGDDDLGPRSTGSR
jgi:hypothetical protein